jgi:hypothetical protein
MYYRRELEHAIHDVQDMILVALLEVPDTKVRPSAATLFTIL